MSQGKRLYESAAVWSQALQAGQRNLVRAMSDFFPSDVRTVLDVGCGDGKVTSALMEATGRSILGLDFSREALSRCNFTTVYGDAADLPFLDGEFDLVLCVDTLEHMPDEMEEKVWRQIFRVASKTVMVSVPFREELLDATACCRICGTYYHVNWHIRSYDWPQLIAKAPPSWKATTVVLTGEKWSPYHPLETRFRRHVLDEWSGWTDAFCPGCGAEGSAPDAAEAIPPHTAVALGQAIYASLKSGGVSRSHSEILILYHRLDNMHTLSGEVIKTLAEPVEATVVRVTVDALDNNLVPYPEAAKAVRGTDGGMVVQLPVYDAVQTLIVTWSMPPARPLPLYVEDGFGVLFSDTIAPDAELKTTISLPRAVVPGYYGVLVRTGLDVPVASIKLGAGPTGLLLSPQKDHSFGYYQFDLPQCYAFIQVEKPGWTNVESLMRPKHPRERVSWKALFDQIVTRVQHHQLRAERDQLEAERDQLEAERDQLEAERDQLRADLDSLASRPVVRISLWLRRRLQFLRANTGREVGR